MDSSDTQSELKRESTGGVLGVSFGLLLAAGLFIGLVGFRGGEVDGEERLRELFGLNEPPFGLTVARAAKLPTGDLILQLEGSHDADAKGPEEVLLIEYQSRAGLAPLFSGSEKVSETMQTWTEDPSFAWKALLERDEIRWGEWRTKFARMRHFAEGGGWTETACVDLSQPGRYLALLAKWGEEEEVDRKELLEVLSCIEMLAAKDD